MILAECLFHQLYIFLWSFESYGNGGNLGGLATTRFIPHFGHFPCFFLTTSGCMGQVYFFAFIPR